MKLAKVRYNDGNLGVVLCEDDQLHPLDLMQLEDYQNLADILNAPDSFGLTKFLVDKEQSPVALNEVKLLAPVDGQDVWAAGVTYKRSQVARMEESESGADHYDKVYTADRPELFFKSRPERVVAPGDAIRVRFDSNWTVPEPELALMISPDLKLVGFTVGNDVSSRDIEGANPLYLPQAKVYNQSCALGPMVLLADDNFDREKTSISLKILRGEETYFSGNTSLDQMVRGFDDLISWLGRDNDFPQGAVLLTGTGIVPPDEVTLEDGDVVQISIAGIGTLENPVVKGKAP